eukprot:4560_1
MESIYKSIDSLFEELLIKYFISNIKIMNNLFYQMINSLTYFLQLNVAIMNNDNALNLKSKLIGKLVFIIKRTVVPCIDYNKFINSSKYKQSLDNLTQMESFDTNLFDGKPEETGSECKSKKRTFNQVEGVLNENTQSLKRRKLQRYV